MRSFKFLFVALALVLLSSATELRAADTFKVDSAHSFLLFHVRHFGAGNVYGRFNDPTGTIVWDEADASKSSIEIEAKSDNIDTGSQKRDDHLKGPDFFNAPQFPTLTFKSTKVEKGAKAGELKITGDLTIHGVTKPVNVTATKLGEGKNQQGKPIAGFETKFTIKRGDYDMNFMEGAIGDEVHITVALEAAKQ